jgi:hypothetical protein
LCFRLKLITAASGDDSPEARRTAGVAIAKNPSHYRGVIFRHAVRMLALAVLDKGGIT